MAIQAHLYTDNLGFSFGSSQDLMMDNNQSCFTTHHHQIFPHKLMNHHIILPRQYSNITEPMPFSQVLHTQMEKQKMEIDQFTTLQNEKLRWFLNEQKKQQLALIWRKYESKLEFLLKQKDEEIAKAANRTKELEEYLKKMEMENQAWQRIANENEAMVMSLNNTIEQLRESGYCLSTNGEDAESCCDVHDDEQEQTRKMICKSCICRFSCMIFLPCRHLSSCKACDSLLHQCPVCGIAKKASIEALI
ncbi:unnamed protein product [Withania somnifera]